MYITRQTQAHRHKPTGAERRYKMLNQFPNTVRLFHEALNKKQFVIARDILIDIQTCCFSDSDWKEIEPLQKEFREAEDRENSTKLVFSLDDLIGA